MSGLRIIGALALLGGIGCSESSDTRGSNPAEGLLEGSVDAGSRNTPDSRLTEDPAQSSVDAGLTSELPQCPDVSSASGFGVSAEGQCSPASFTGEGAVIDVVQNAARTEYRIAFEGVEASEDCGPLAPSALIIVNAGSPVDVALGAGQSVNVVFHTLSDATAGNLWTYLELRDPNSGSLLFLHHFYDSRFLEAGHLHVGDEFSFKLAHPCRFEHACYRTAERYRLIDAERGIDVSEYESAEATVRGQRFGVYVRSARRQADFRQGECAGARADLGTFLALDIVARAPE